MSDALGYKTGFWHKVHDWLIEKSKHKHAFFWLFVITFLESCISPIPPDLILIPMVLSRPDQVWRIAYTAIVASIIGGILGYFIGFALFEILGQKLVSFYGFTNKFHAFQAEIQKWGFWIISFKGFLPIPFKFIAITAGIVNLKFSTFVLASIIARSFRFCLLSRVIKAVGPKFAPYFRKFFLLFFLGIISTLSLGAILINCI